MPQTRIAVDALGVVTISLVALLSLFGLFCIIYTLYFRFRVRRSGFVQLGYFNGPWIIRIVLVLIGIWWGIGEIIRLSFLRRRFIIFNSLGQKWQEDICRYYILSNLGFAEPCLFVTMGFLLRASLQWRDSGTLNRRWNFRTTGYILLCCLPVFILDLIFVLVGPKFDKDNKRKVLRLPHSFTSTHLHHQSDEEQRVSTAICTYPLLCTILHGMFAVLLTTYLLLLGRRVVSSVINKGLQRRVYVLIFLVSSFFPSRIILLGFSVLARADFLVEALAFSGFLVLLLCVVVGMFMLVYLPISDSLALRRGLLLGSTMSGGGGGPDRASRSLEDCVALIGPTTTNSYGIDVSAPTNTTTTTSSTGRNSDASTKRGSISFRTMIREEDCGTVGVFEEEMANTFSLGSNTNLNTNQNRISSSGSPSGTTTITPFGLG